MNTREKINLLLSIDGLHHGGAERVIASLCRNLDPARFSVTVWWRTACGAIGDELKADGVNVIGVPEFATKVTVTNRFLTLRRILRDLKIDIVHTHDTGALTDAVHCRLSGSKSKIVHTFHFGNYPNKERRHLLLDAVYGRFAHRLIAVGFNQASRIEAALHLPPNRLQVLYNGVECVDFSKNNFRSLIDVPAEPIPVIGSISTLTEQKGLPFLVEAAGILRDRGYEFLLAIAGDGPLRQSLEDQRNRLGLNDRVHFLGWVPNAANQLLGSLDIFCQSSLWEANSIVLLEAMAAGVPIVTTAVGESEHVIINGESGAIVEPGKAEQLADALGALIDSAETRKRIGVAAKERYEMHYTIDTMIKNHQELYEELVSD